MNQPPVQFISARMNHSALHGLPGSIQGLSAGRGGLPGCAIPASGQLRPHQYSQDGKIRAAAAATEQGLDLLGFHSYPGGILYGPAPGAWPQAGREHFGPVRSKTTQISAVMENRGGWSQPIEPSLARISALQLLAAGGHATVLRQVDSSFHACRA